MYIVKLAAERYTFKMLLFLLYFGPNKCRLGEKRLKKNLTVQKYFTGSVELIN